MVLVPGVNCDLGALVKRGYWFLGLTVVLVPCANCAISDTGSYG